MVLTHSADLRAAGRDSRSDEGCGRRKLAGPRPWPLGEVLPFLVNRIDFVVVFFWPPLGFGDLSCPTRDGTHALNSDKVQSPNH